MCFILYISPELQNQYADRLQQDMKSRWVISLQSFKTSLSPLVFLGTEASGWSKNKAGLFFTEYKMANNTLCFLCGICLPAL